jgi:nitrite reductase/ring-hydroxylating ferredoxin subunit
VSEFDANPRRFVSIGDKEVGVFYVDGEFVAYENRCPHQGGPVCKGRVLGRVEAVLGPDQRVVEERFSDTDLHLVCPWHGFEFDLKTGVCPADGRFRLKAETVVEQGGEVYLELE